MSRHVSVFFGKCVSRCVLRVLSRPRLSWQPRADAHGARASARSVTSEELQRPWRQERIPEGCFCMRGNKEGREKREGASLRLIWLDRYRGMVDTSSVVFCAAKRPQLMAESRKMDGEEARVGKQLARTWMGRQFGTDACAESQLIYALTY